MHKGIILAGGKGTRLSPLTKATCKQLLPVYDKPMIYYPLSVLLRCGIEDILVITNPEDRDRFFNLLEHGKNLNCNIKYAIQEEPKGLADALIIGEDFLNGSPSALILGDNIFYGSEVNSICMWAIDHPNACMILGYKVADPRAYGVAIVTDPHFEFPFELCTPLIIEEKPDYPASSIAIPGLYFFPSNGPTIAKQLKPSERGELEIIDLIKAYINTNHILLGTNMARLGLMSDESFWFDAGTFDSLLEVSEFVAATQKRKGILIGDPALARKEYLSQWKEEGE